MALTTIKLAAMAANSIDSDQYVDASIDNAHLADDAVDGAKLANNIDIAGTLDVTGLATFDAAINTTAQVYTGDSYNGNEGCYLASDGVVMGEQAVEGNDVFRGKYDGNTTSTIKGSGAATFAGNTVIGPWNESSASGEGFTLRSRGQLLQQLKSDTSEASAYVLQKGTAAKITFTPDGAATFAGNATFGGDVDADVNTDGVYLGADGKIRARASSGTGYCFIGSKNGSGTSTTIINGDGNAYFAGGVSVGGTGAANTLDDYEEGTFTPIFDTFSSASTVSHSEQTGRYTKIGDTVYFSVEIRCTVSSWGSGTWKVSGLPFTCWSGYNNPPVLASKLSWQESGGSYVYKDDGKDYRWDHWWNQAQFYGVDLSNQSDWRPTTATDLQGITLTAHGSYLTN